MTKTYIVSEEVLRQVLAALNSVSTRCDDFHHSKKIATNTTRFASLTSGINLPPKHSAPSSPTLRVSRLLVTHMITALADTHRYSERTHDEIRLFQPRHLHSTVLHYGLWRGVLFPQHQPVPAGRRAQGWRMAPVARVRRVLGRQGLSVYFRVS